MTSSRTPNIGIGAVLERAYARYASRPAVTDGIRTRTYGELAERAHRFANGLAKTGVDRGDRVVVLLPNTIESFEVDAALFTAGLVRVAVSVRLHPREIAYILRDSDAAALVTDLEWAERLGSSGEFVADDIHLVVTGDQVPARALAYEEIMSTGDRQLTGEVPAPDELAALLYTSGTTGSPKGAALTQHNWGAMLRNSLVELPPIDETDVVLHAAPLSHFAGYLAPTFSVRGAAHVVMKAWRGPEALAEIESRRITALPVVPTMIGDLVRAADDTPRDLSCMRSIVYGGSTIAPAVLARAISHFGPVFTQFYGLSEAPMPLTALSTRAHLFDQNDPPPPRLRSAGRPTPYVELRLERDDGSVPDLGEPGEIVVRSDAIMKGYWQNDQATTEMIDDDGWLRTGDVGVIDAEGYVTIVERKKDVIITGGYNVYPAEVEHAIATLAGVLEVGVVSAPHERLGEMVKAFVVVRERHVVTEEDVLDACRQNLANFKRPRSVEFVEQLPKTGSGKIMRRALRDTAGS